MPLQDYPHFTHHPQAQGFSGHPHFWSAHYKIRGSHYLVKFSNLQQWLRELRKMLYLQLWFYYRKKKKTQIKISQKKIHISWVWKGLKHVASVSSSCSVRMHHLSGTLMCNNTHRLLQTIVNKQRRKLAGALVSRVFLGFHCIRMTDWIIDRPHDLTQSPDPNPSNDMVGPSGMASSHSESFYCITYLGPTINKKDTLWTLTIKCGPRDPWWTKRHSSYSRNPKI